MASLSMTEALGRDPIIARVTAITAHAHRAAGRQNHPGATIEVLASDFGFHSRRLGRGNHADPRFHLIG